MLLTLVRICVPRLTTSYLFCSVIFSRCPWSRSRLRVKRLQSRVYYA